MLPNSIKSELAHRKIKRQLEIDLVIKEVKLFNRNNELKRKGYEILEFGSGNGFQIPFLKKLGNLTSSDIYISDEIKKMKEKSFVCCDITKSPFPNNKFDLIFSNHVVEHIPDKTALFNELRRISSRECVLAISVPTNLWLLLTIPGQYYRRLRNVIMFVKNFLFNSPYMNYHTTPSDDNFINVKNSRINLFKYLLPQGHGSTTNYLKCYNEFKINSWAKLFEHNGLSIIKIVPLLLYGPSEWPLVNTKLSQSKVVSSVLFLMHFDG